MLSSCSPLTFMLISHQRELQQLTDTSGASGHQKLRVCDVCGAYLSVLDSDRRLADHFGGKVCHNELYVKNLPYELPRCTWDTTNCETCFPNSKKNARSARCRHHRQQPHLAQEHPRLRMEVLLVEVTIVISEAHETNIATVIEDTSDMVPVTSE